MKPRQVVLGYINIFLLVPAPADDVQVDVATIFILFSSAGVHPGMHVLKVAFSILARTSRNNTGFCVAKYAQFLHPTFDE